MSLRIRKPKTRKGKKILLAREAQTIEQSRLMLFLDGRKSGGDIKLCMKDFQQLRKPLLKVLKRKNDISPFDDASSLEYLTLKNDCAIFAFGSNSKKRPNNLVLGRTFENEILDMVEFGIKKYKTMQEFKVDKVGTCVKPCLIFNGPQWSQVEEMRRLCNLFVDTFHKEKVESIRLQGIEHVISFTCLEERVILMRSYRILLKKSGERTPRVELVEIGPSAHLSIRRTKIASDELFKNACKVPKTLKIAKKKKTTRDVLGNTHARVHISKQKVTTIQTRRVKALKKSPVEESNNHLKRKEPFKIEACIEKK